LIPNCIQQTGGICNTCLTGYLPSTNGLQCLVHIDFCTQISGSICTLCINGYHPGNYGLTCQPDIVFCLKYIDTTILSVFALCSQCQTGYNPSSDSSACLPSIVCPAGNHFFASTNICSPNIIPDTPITIPNCMVSADNITCTVCNEGYYIYQGRCASLYYESFSQNTNYIVNTSTPNATFLSCMQGSYPIITKLDFYQCIFWSHLSYSELTSNCAAFDEYTPGSFRCSLCHNKYFLTPDYTCVVDCIAYKSNYSSVFSSVININKQFPSGNYCQLDDPSIAKRTISTDYSFKPVSCSSGYVATPQLNSYVPLNIEYIQSNILFNSGLSTSPNTLYSSVSCIPSTNATVISNCALYSTINGNSQYTCLKCSKGYQGILSGQTIVSCRAMSLIDSCNTSFAGQGLVKTILDPSPSTFTLSSLFSCFKCLDSSRIPIVAGVFNFAVENNVPRIVFKGFSSFSIISNPSSSSKFTDASGTLPNTFCKQNLGSEFSFIDVSSTSNALPTNCGLAVLNVNSTYNSASSIPSGSANFEFDINSKSAALMCVACNPGYKAIYFTYNGTSFTNFVAKCVPIIGCNVRISNTFNSCDICYLGFAVINGVTQYDQCSTNSSIVNCYGVDILNNVCLKCNTGFILNSVTNLCDKVSLSNNDYFAYGVTGDIDPVNKVVNNATFTLEDLYLKPYGNGSIVCSYLFTPIRLFQQQINAQCLTSSYMIANQPQFPNSSVFIPNCQQHSLNNTNLICYLCISGYAVNTQGTCTSTTLNCRVLSSDNTKCTSCLSSFTFLSGSQKCVRTIAHCISYNMNATSWSTACLNCETGFALSNSLCQTGTIPGCQIYTGPTCSQCLKGYTLLTGSAASYCVSISGTHCDSYDPILMKQNTLKCVTCKTGYSIVPQVTSGCVAITLIDGCINYNDNGVFGNSSLVCIECDNGYTINNGNCIANGY